MPCIKGDSALELPVPAGVTAVGLGTSPTWHAGGWPGLSPCQPLGSQSSKEKHREDLGSLPRLLADSALISVVLKENLMFWLLWGRVGW